MDKVQRSKIFRDFTIILFLFFRQPVINRIVAFVIKWNSEENQFQLQVIASISDQLGFFRHLMRAAIRKLLVL